MQVNYKRDMNHNYLVIIEEAKVVTTDYQARMLMDNDIEGILKFHTRRVDDKIEYYYEISSKQPLSRILERREITANEIKSILWRVYAIISETEKYLLDYNCIILDPDYIYLDPEEIKIYLCIEIKSEKEFSTSLRELLQFFLDKVNHEDKESVALAYNLYQESTKDNFKMEDIMKLLGKKGLENSLYNSNNNLNPNLNDNSDISTNDRIHNILDESDNNIDYRLSDMSSKSDDNKRTIYKKEERKKNNRDDELEIVKRHMKNSNSKNSNSKISYKPDALFNNYLIPLIIILISIIGLFKYIESNIYNETFEDNFQIIAVVCIVIGFINMVVIKKFIFDKKPAIISNSVGGAEDKLFKKEDMRNQTDSKIKGIINKHQNKTDNNLHKNNNQNKVNDILHKKNNNQTQINTIYKSNTPRQRRKIMIDINPKAEDSAYTEPEDTYLDFELEEHEPISDKSIATDSLRFTESNKTMLLYDEEKPNIEKVRKLVNEDQENWDTIEIKKIPFIIGKLLEFTDYQLNENCISRLHAKIDESEGIYYITDLNSTNGTFINEQRLVANEQRQINIGDEIMFANIKYIFK